MTDYKDKYDDLVEVSWELVNSYNSHTSHDYEYAHREAMQRLENKLPPRKPKTEEVPWYLAVEGLISGKYSKVLTGCGAHLVSSYGVVSKGDGSNHRLNCCIDDCWEVTLS